MIDINKSVGICLPIGKNEKMRFDHMAEIARGNPDLERMLMKEAIWANWREWVLSVLWLVFLVASILRWTG